MNIFKTLFLEFILKYKAWLGFILSIILGNDYNLDFYLSEEEEDDQEQKIKEESDSSTSSSFISSKVVNFEYEYKEASKETTWIMITYYVAKIQEKILGWSIIVNVGIAKGEEVILNYIENLIYNRPSFHRYNQLNIIDTDSLIKKILSFMNIDNLDNQSYLILYSILIILICIIYIFYIFSFVIAPSIFDAIKDILPIRIKDYLTKLININRKVSVPFVILSFIMLIFGLFFAVLFLSIVFLFKS